LKKANQCRRPVAGNDDTPVRSVPLRRRQFHRPHFPLATHSPHFTLPAMSCFSSPSPSLAHFFPLGTLAFAGLAAFAPVASARLEKFLPAETYYAAQLADAPGLLKRATAHPLAADIQKTNFTTELAASIKRYQDTLTAYSRESENNSGADYGKIWTDFTTFQKVADALKRDLSGEVLCAKIKTLNPDKDHNPEDAVLANIVVLADTTANEEQIAELIDAAGLQRNWSQEYPETLYNYWKARERGENPPAPPTPEPDAPKVAYACKITKTLFQGVTLHEEIYTVAKKEPTSHGGWAFVNKTFVYATSPTALRELVDAVQKGRKNTFGETNAWRRGTAAAGKFDFFFIVNTPLFNERFRAGYIARRAKEQPSMLKAESEKRYDELGLGTIKSLWFSARLTKDEVVGKYALGYLEKRGLLSILQFLPLETPVPSFVPAGIGGLSVEKVNPQQIAKNLEAQMSLAGDEGKAPWQTIDEMKMKDGLDVRGALVENLGEHQSKIRQERLSIEDYSLLSAGVTNVEIDFSQHEVGVGFILKTRNDEVGLLEIRDTNKLASLIDTFAGKRGGVEALFRENVFMGEKIRTFKFPTAQVAGHRFGFSYALFDGRLLYEFHLFDGGPSMLPKVIAEIKKPESPAAKEPDMQRILKRVQKNAHNFYYYDLKDGLHNLLHVIDDQGTNWQVYLHQQKEEKAKAEAEGKGEKYAPKPFESSELDGHSKIGVLPWVGFMSSKEDGNELSGEAVILRKETPAKK
jgi:hypothetical protein